ncbi:MAG: PaaI family thioesterase [Pseudomonadales bacterium]|nr:PaaI family thioesterase [Pseudomonadales bacterium]
MEFNEKIAKNFMIPPKDGLAGYLGFNISDASLGKMTGYFDVKEELLTPFGNMHGGVLSAFCDHMLGCVCYPAMKKGQWAATTEFKINLMRPVSEGRVIANAQLVNMGRTMAVVKIDFTNNDRFVATAQGTVTIVDPK